MENKSAKNSIFIGRSAESYAECAAEYILPDYKNDVKRVLHTEVRVLNAGNFCDADGCEFTGVLVFTVLYLDAENGLSSVTFSQDYTLRSPMTDGDPCGVIKAENVSVRLTGPRKMLARCTLKASVRSESETDVSSGGTTFDEENRAECCEHTVSAVHAVRGRLADREYAEQLFFAEGVSSQDVDIISKHAEARINSVSPKDGSVIVSGEIKVACLVGGGATPTLREVRIPFEENVSAPDSKSSAEALAKCDISSLECIVSPLDDGVRVTASVIADFEVLLFENTAARIVTDVFSPINEVENKYESLHYEELVGTKRHSLGLNKEIAKSSTEAECASEVVYMSATPMLLGIKTEGSVVQISGEVRFSGVACEKYDDGTPTYTSIKFSVPFDENVNFNSQIPDKTNVDCRLECYDAKASLDENNFYVACDVSVSVTLFRERNVSRVATSEVLSEAKDRTAANVIKVYYPESTDTLFDVAKHFKSSVLKIAQDNALTEEAVSTKDKPNSLSGVEKLIIKSFG